MATPAAPATPAAAPLAAPLAAAPLAAAPFAEAGRLGVGVPLAALRARLGGPAPLRRVLAALTVTEAVHPGKPRGMSRTTRHAYAIRRTAVGTADAGAAEEILYVPAARAAALAAVRVGGAPLLANVRAGAGDNRPLPVPRRFAAGRAAEAEPLYAYQEAAVAYLVNGPLAAGAPGTAGAAPWGAAGAAQDVARGAAPWGAAQSRAVYLQMDTGLGKSRVAAAVAARRGEPALVVVPTDAIAEQWVDEFAELCPGLAVAVYRNPAPRARRPAPGPETHDVVIVIVNTLRDKPPAFMEGYGLVVLDEAHEYHSACNSRVLWLAQTRAVLGLSATPAERPDGLDRLVELFLGAVVVAARDVPGFDAGAVAFRGRVRAIEYAGHPDCCETAVTPAGTMSAVLTIGNLTRDAARARLVAAEAVRLYFRHEDADAAALAAEGLGPRPAAAATPAHPAGGLRRHGVLVFAEHREYLPALRDALAQGLAARLGAAAAAEALYAPELGAGRELAPELGGDPAAAPERELAVSILRGGVAKTAVGDARRLRSHVVLTTYGYSRRGVSLPEMTALVLATPRRNGSVQILGRILRRGSDESIVRVVVDVVDVRTGLKSQAAARRRAYAAKGYPVERIAASHDSAPGATPGATQDGAAPDDAEPNTEPKPATLDDVYSSADK